MSDLTVRQALIQRLQEGLEAQASVHAAWLEGVDALSRADSYSDLDLWLDVDAGAEAAAFEAVRRVLETFGPLDVEQVRLHPDGQIQQHFYRSAGLPPFLFVDVCVQAHGRNATFGPEDAFLPLFDRMGVLRRETPPAPTLALEAQHVLEQRWRWILVEKELQRGHGLEALRTTTRRFLSRWCVCFGCATARKNATTASSTSRPICPTPTFRSWRAFMP